MTPLHTKLNQLSLTTMSHQLDQTILMRPAGNLSFPQTLEALADLELEARSARSIERRFRLSRLQAQHAIDSFNFKHHKSRTELKARILQLLDLDFLQKGTSAIFIGNPGVGPGRERHRHSRSSPSSRFGRQSVRRYVDRRCTHAECTIDDNKVLDNREWQHARRFWQGLQLFDRADGLPLSPEAAQILGSKGQTLKGGRA